VLLRHNPQSAEIAILFDGKLIGYGGERNLVNCYVPYRTLSRASGAPDFQSTKGKHRMTLRYATNPGNVETPTVGIDFFWMQRP